MDKLCFRAIIIHAIKIFWKFAWNVTFQVFLKISLKLWNICVVLLNSNLQYGTWKHLKVYVKCHFSSFSKKRRLKSWQHLCCHKHKFVILYIKTFWKFMWNVTFQVFLKKQVEKLGTMCCRKHKFAILYIKTFWKFTWNVTFRSFSKKSWKIGKVCVVINIKLQYCSYLKMFWKFMWNNTFQVFLNKS